MWDASAYRSRDTAIPETAEVPAEISFWALSNDIGSYPKAPASTTTFSSVKTGAPDGCDKAMDLTAQSRRTSFLD